MTLSIAQLEHKKAMIILQFWQDMEKITDKESKEYLEIKKNLEIAKIDEKIAYVKSK
jgi:hypothetical protein